MRNFVVLHKSETSKKFQKDRKLRIFIESFCSLSDTFSTKFSNNPKTTIPYTNIDQIHY